MKAFKKPKDSNAVLAALLIAACERFDTNPDSVKKAYYPKTPPAEKVIMARGYFIALARSIKIPLTNAAKHINITGTSAYNAQVQYHQEHGYVESETTLEILRQ